MSLPEHGVRLPSSARTSTGQVRENNEDNIHLWTGDQFVLAIVADGMGGAAAGEEASRIAVETIKSGFDPLPRAGGEDQPVTERLRDVIHEANISIVRKATSSPEMRGMGTTLTLAYIRGTYATFAHVGDSRAYYVDSADQSIAQITADHSFVQALINSGYITPDQAENHPMSNVLYRALGQAEDIDIDIYYKRLHLGDRVILCSDGLTRHLKSSEIAEIVTQNANPDVATQKLVDLTNSRGGEDNISVIVIAVEADPDAKPLKEAEVSTENDETTLILKTNPFRRKRDTIETVETPLMDKEDTIRLPNAEAEFRTYRNGDTPTRIPIPTALPEVPEDPTDPTLPAVETPLDNHGDGHDTRTPEQ
ncbi:MAG: Stp1/IreP family PP2C-type Ser/Thr phosphatase [Anaerolineae bacterium]|nr:Stp1/IreP family PP2C-type Ser/Thr phosphatase [Anaerolineae bacterium]